MLDVTLEYPAVQAYYDTIRAKVNAGDTEAIGTVCSYCRLPGHNAVDCPESPGGPSLQSAG